jgi:hypothetical protein
MGRIESVEPVETIIHSMVNEFRAVRDRLRGIE